MENLNILIVDDDRGIGRFISTALKSEAKGYTINLSGNGLECIDYIDNGHEVDCILSDYDMPGMDGMELLTTLRSRGNNVPFIFLTAQGSEEIAREAFKNGADDYFTKDIGFAHFPRIINSIEQAVRRHAAEAEHERAEEALRESETKYRLLVEDTSVGVIIIQDGRVVYRNPRQAEMIGYTPEELAGSNNAFEFVHPDDREFVRGMMISCMEGAGGGTFEFRVMHKDGSEVYLEAYGKMTDYKGRPAMLGVSVDVTDRKIAEKALKDSEERFRTLFETANDAILLLEGDKFIDCNTKAVEMFGCDTSDDIVGREPYVFSPETQHDYRPSKEKALEYIHAALSGTPQRFEWTHCKKDGSEFEVEVSLNSLVQGGRTYLQAIVRDITERFRAQEEMARLAEAVTSTADGICIIDKNGAIHYANPAFEKITGYSRSELAGMKPDRLIGREGGDETTTGIGETIRSGQTWNGWFVLLRKDGARREVELSISPDKNPYGEITSYVAVGRDITERKRLMSIAESVDSMNNLGYVFASVRHEAGGPISTVGMTLNMLREGFDEFSREDVLDSLGACINEVDRVKYIMHSLKSFNMYEIPAPGEISLSSFMDNFLPLVRGDFARSGVDVEYRDETGGCVMKADPRALQQVMLNIMSNAADALSGTGGAHILITVSCWQDMVKIKVVDNGAGMTDEQKAGLFKPFYTSKKHGTGLGLVIAKRMLSMMDGTIDINSKAGEGTTVEITLPEVVDENQ